MSLDLIAIEAKTRKFNTEGLIRIHKATLAIKIRDNRFQTSLLKISSNMNDIRSQGYEAVYNNFYSQPNQYPDDLNVQNYDPNDNGNYGN